MLRLRSRSQGGANPKWFGNPGEVRGRRSALAKWVFDREDDEELSKWTRQKR